MNSPNTPPGFPRGNRWQGNGIPSTQFSLLHEGGHVSHLSTLQGTCSLLQLSLMPLHSVLPHILLLSSGLFKLSCLLPHLILHVGLQTITCRPFSFSVQEPLLLVHLIEGLIECMLSRSITGHSQQDRLHFCAHSLHPPPDSHMG